MDYTLTQPYGPLWKKYRTVIVKMMVDAKTGPQHYQLFEHEVRLIIPASKNPAFTLRALHGTKVLGSKDSVMGRDLLLTLQASAKAQELMQTATYEFTLKRDYTLHVAIADA